MGKTIGDPNDNYEYYKPLWKKSRAIIGGQYQTKQSDLGVSFDNILLPFSPTMTLEQFNFYKAEAELPGLVSQYTKVLVGGLTRKTPTLTLPEDAPEGAKSWIMDEFSNTNESLAAFLASAVVEEIQTSRCWVYIDYPFILDYSLLSIEETNALKPYPIIFRAESVINWLVGIHPLKGSEELTHFVVRSKQDNGKNIFHPEYDDIVTDYRLDSFGLFEIATYKEVGSKGWQEINVNANILSNGERLDYIPAFPLNGSIEGVEPLIMPLIDREVSLYNKISRRNHLLLGSATFTPVVYSDMGDTEFEAIVSKGLGSWLHLRADDKMQAFETPSDVLKDMEKSISATIEEMAKMGIRMLANESTSADVSGVALEIRNASQTAILTSLGTRISQQMRAVITRMLNWRYGTDYTVSEVEFDINTDLNPAPLGEEWLRLVTDWYEGRIIPRSLFFNIVKKNDIVPQDYNDDLGRKEIDTDESIIQVPTEITIDKEAERSN